ALAAACAWRKPSSASIARRSGALAAFSLAASAAAAAAAAAASAGPGGAAAAGGRPRRGVCSPPPPPPGSSGAPSPPETRGGRGGGKGTSVGLRDDRGEVQLVDGRWVLLEELREVRLAIGPRAIRPELRRQGLADFRQRAHRGWTGVEHLEHVPAIVEPHRLGD